MYGSFDLFSYLPTSFKTPNEQEYIAFLWEAFETNYSCGNYQFAFLAYHMLMMSFTYFKLWQVRRSSSSDFEKSLIGFGRDDERNWLRDPSPFTFGKVSERAVIRLFRLIGCDDSQIGSYKKLVDDRNAAAHANGNVFFSTRYEIDEQIHKVLIAVDEIQIHSGPVIEKCYRRFLLDSHEPELREHMIAEDQVREILIHGNYMSPRDIELCAKCDISVLLGESKQAIEDLHSTLLAVQETALEDRV